MTTLLESKARPYGSSKGVALSMALHGVVVAGIIFGTAKAVLPPREKIEEHPVLYVASPPPPPIETPKPLPEVKAPPKVAAPKQRFVAPPPKAAPRPVAPPRPTIAAPAKVALSVPSVDVKLAPVSIDVPTVAEPPKAAPEPTSGSGRKSGDDADASGRSSGGLGSGSAGRAYSENQVERAAEVTRAANARYPEALRSVNVEGEVVMQFIVGADGKVEPGSMEVKSSPHKQFSDAVRVALMATRYRPAEVGGNPVRQLVQQTFKFSLSK